MKSSLSLQSLVGVLLLPTLFSCSRQALNVSGADDHYNADTYYIAGGFDAEEDRQGREASINDSGDNSTNRDRGTGQKGQTELDPILVGAIMILEGLIDGLDPVDGRTMKGEMTYWMTIWE